MEQSEVGETDRNARSKAKQYLSCCTRVFFSPRRTSTARPRDDVFTSNVQIAEYPDSTGPPTPGLSRILAVTRRFSFRDSTNPGAAANFSDAEGKGGAWACVVRDPVAAGRWRLVANYISALNHYQDCVLFLSPGLWAALLLPPSWIGGGGSSSRGRMQKCGISKGIASRRAGVAMDVPGFILVISTWHIRGNLNFSHILC